MLRLGVDVDVERLREELDDVTLLLVDDELVLRPDTVRLRDAPVAVVPVVTFAEPLVEEAEPLPTEFWAAAAFDVPRDDCP